MIFGGKTVDVFVSFCFSFQGYGSVRCYINAVRVVASFISSRTKQRTMSQNTLSPGDEPIQPTQSVEYVLETETQEELPETQESVTNYDIFEYDDFVDTQEIDPTVDYDDNGCSQCGNVVTADPFLRWHITWLCEACKAYYARG